MRFEKIFFAIPGGEREGWQVAINELPRRIGEIPSDLVFGRTSHIAETDSLEIGSIYSDNQRQSCFLAMYLLVVYPFVSCPVFRSLSAPSSPAGPLTVCPAFLPYFVAHGNSLDHSVTRPTTRIFHLIETHTIATIAPRTIRKARVVFTQNITLVKLYRRKN